MTPFPNEILLAFFAEFHLTTLIAARGVCRNWRNLLDFADIHPSRKSLLEIYLQIIAEPWFVESRPWVLDNLVPFDREAYVDAILKQHHYLPEDFRIWILEWPAKAVIGGIWPGLPEIISDDVGPNDIGRRGWNLMGCAKPLVCMVKHINNDLDVGGAHDDTQLVEPLPGLPLFEDEGNLGRWILLDTGRYRDQVLWAGRGDTFAATDGPEFCVRRWPNWIDYMNQDELPRLRCKYPSSKRVRVSMLRWTFPPNGYRIPFMTWSAKQKPYRRSRN